MLSLLLNHQQNDLSCLPATTPLLTFSGQHRHQQNLNLCSQQRASEVCLEFWRKHESDLNKLYRLAMTVLSVPATSAAVERVFSHGGLTMKPHRVQMSDKLLSNLIF